MIDGFSTHVAGAAVCAEVRVAQRAIQVMVTVRPVSALVNWVLVVVRERSDSGPPAPEKGMNTQADDDVMMTVMEALDIPPNERPPQGYESS